MVVAAVQEEADLARLARIEDAAEPGFGGAGRAALAGRDLDADAAGIGAHDLRQIALVGGANVDPAGELAVELVRDAWQRVAPVDERVGQPRADARVVRFGQAAHGVGDDGIGEPALEVGDDGVPGLARRAREQPAVERARAPGQAKGTGIVAVEADVMGVAEGDQLDEQPIHACERPVAIARDRLPYDAVAPIEGRPSPLARMAVPVADEDVDQARAQVRLVIEAVARGLLEAIEERLAAGDAAGARREHRAALFGLVGPLLDETEQAGELGAVLAEAGVVGHDDEARIGLQHARRLDQRRDHEGAERQDRADLVLQDARGDAFAQRRLERARRVLVDRAERVDAAIRPQEPEGTGLQAAAQALERESAREAAEVEHLDADGRRPQVAVAAAQQQTVEESGVVAAARRGPHGIGGLRVDGRAGQEGGGQERRGRGATAPAGGPVLPGAMRHRGSRPVAAAR